MALLSGLFNILVGYSWLAGALGTDDTDPHCKFLPAETRDTQDTTYFHMVKAARLPSGTTYRYVVHRPSIEKPWLLFLHGFPSTSFDWRYQFEHFASLGYGIIAPDLLGYGGTDNPPELDRFALKIMVNEIEQLLDCEGVEKAVGIAHDLCGSVVLSRVITYLPERLTAVAFLTVGYATPPLAFNEAGIDLINKATEEAVGYTTFGYWGFMNEDDAAPITDANLDSAFTLLYTHDPDYFLKHFAPIGEYKKWLLAGRIAPWTKYLEEESKSIFKRIYNYQGGFDGPLKTYKSMMRDVNLAHKNVPESAAYIKQPVLLITAARDRIALPEAQINNTKSFAADINITSVDAGHFLQVEKPQEVNKKLEAFINCLA